MDRLAAIFARVSEQEKQDQERGNDQVDTLDTQLARCRDLAQAHGIPIADESSGLIVRAVHSGTDLLWQGSPFMRLVGRAQDHDFTDLVCLNVDRFCRGGSNAFREQLNYLTTANVAVHFVQLPLPADMPFRESVQGFIADAAKYWRDGIVEASTRVRTAQAQAGNIIPGNTPPFGFRFVYDTTRSSKRNRPLIMGLEPDPVAGPALLHITHHIANRGSVWSAKYWLEGNNIPTPRRAPVWSTASIRRILHNPTNYGERRSFVLRSVERPNAARRAATLKSKHMRVRVEVGDPAGQYKVDSARITPIPGLTVDLWKRAVDQLAENKAFSPRHATLPEEQRAEHGLLFGGPLRCTVCGHALIMKRTSNYSRSYYCPHTNTSYEGTTATQISTKKLDATVWSIAVAAMRDPAFFERLVADTDAANGASLRAASLRTQLADAEHERDILKKRLRRLDPDDPDDAALGEEYEADLIKNRATREHLLKALAAAEALAADEEARRATLAAFRAYAQEQRDTLDTKTPIERRRILLALKTRCQVPPGGHLGRIRIRFDLRHLPGAEQWFREPDVDEVDAMPFEPPQDGRFGGPSDDYDLDLSDVPSVDIEYGTEVAEEGTDGMGDEAGGVYDARSRR